MKCTLLKDFRGENSWPSFKIVPPGFYMLPTPIDTYNWHCKDMSFYPSFVLFAIAFDENCDINAKASFCRVLIPFIGGCFDAFMCTQLTLGLPRWGSGRMTHSQFSANFKSAPVSIQPLVTAVMQVRALMPSPPQRQLTQMAADTESMKSDWGAGKMMLYNH